VYLFGLSFYTEAIAYLNAGDKFGFDKILSVSNPFLLSTEPIALSFRSIGIVIKGVNLNIISLLSSSHPLAHGNAAKKLKPALCELLNKALS
jgi:hypothetical protein|tara:strand:+ start:842 stop:1117 length:276 start_codon:yes stop_codon:yes gene_type:complete